MAETKTEKKENLVRYKAFKDNDRYKNDIIIGINGKRWEIPRGVWVEIPDYVVAQLELDEEQQARAAGLTDALEKAYKRASKNYE